MFDQIMLAVLTSQPKMQRVIHDIFDIDRYSMVEVSEVRQLRVELANSEHATDRRTQRSVCRCIDSESCVAIHSINIIAMHNNAL